MVKKLMMSLIAFPIGAVLVALAVANRDFVRLSLDPFNRADPAISLNLPLYAYVLLSLIAGVMIGGTATWLTQSHWRRAARSRGQEAKRWHAEADRLVRERDAVTAPPEKRLALVK